MEVLLAGATGLTGSALLKELVRAPRLPVFMLGGVVLRALRMTALYLFRWTAHCLRCHGLRIGHFVAWERPFV